MWSALEINYNFCKHIKYKLTPAHCSAHNNDDDDGNENILISHNIVINDYSRENI
jgi:hypothetical protein